MSCCSVTQVRYVAGHSLVVADDATRQAAQDFGLLIRHDNKVGLFATEERAYEACRLIEERAEQIRAGFGTPLDPTTIRYMDKLRRRW